MKTTKVLLTVALTTMLIGASFAMGGHDHDTDHGAEQSTEHSQKQTTCPVMGGKVNPKYYADVEGKRIYVCCPGCIATIKKNPAKYISQIEEKGILLEDVPGN